MSKVKLYLENGEKVAEEVESRLSKKGYYLEKKIGSGAFGSAYLINNGKRVLKITQDEAEAEVASKLVNKKAKNAVKIFKVFKFKNIPEVYFIEMERLFDLSNAEISILENMLKLSKLFEDKRLRTKDIPLFIKRGKKLLSKGIKVTVTDLLKKLYHTDEQIEKIIDVEGKYLKKLMKYIKDPYILGWLVSRIFEFKVKKLYELLLKSSTSRKIFTNIMDSFKNLYDNNIVNNDGHKYNILKNKKGIFKWIDIG